jgi:hypothetical protein
MNIDIFVWSTIILAIWGAVGPLVGVRYGQELAKRWQREQWIRENRKEECRELLNAIYEQFPSRTTLTYEQMFSQDNLSRIFKSRIFIAEDLARLNVQPRWRDMFNNAVDKKVSGDEYQKLREELLEEIKRLAKE